MEKLAKTEELVAYRHEGFWQSMDTLRDKVYLDNLVSNGADAWNTWGNKKECNIC